MFTSYTSKVVAIYYNEEIWCGACSYPKQFKFVKAKAVKKQILISIVTTAVGKYLENLVIFMKIRTIKVTKFDLERTKWVSITFPQQPSANNGCVMNRY